MIVLVKKDLKPFIGDVSADSVPIGLMGLMVSCLTRLALLSFLSLSLWSRDEKDAPKEQDPKPKPVY